MPDMASSAQMSSDFGMESSLFNRSIKASAPCAYPWHPILRIARMRLPGLVVHFTINGGVSLGALGDRSAVIRPTPKIRVRVWLPVFPGMCAGRRGRIASQHETSRTCRQSCVTSDACLDARLLVRADDVVPATQWFAPQAIALTIARSRGGKGGLTSAARSIGQGEVATGPTLAPAVDGIGVQFHQSPGRDVR
jgi:hypothetical protein